MINIIRVGRERLREAYEIVNKVDQGMNVPEWFVAETYEAVSVFLLSISNFSLKHVFRVEINRYC